VASYNKISKKMEYFNPNEKENFENISGTALRNLAKEGNQPPDGFMDQKGWEVLSIYYNSLK
jgi:3'-phosphoadenosine 5'-phosphosulfate synthase